MLVNKRVWTVVTIAALFGLALMAPRVSARPVHVLTPDETYRDADLIVIATPLKTQDLKTINKVPKISL